MPRSINTVSGKINLAKYLCPKPYTILQDDLEPVDDLVKHSSSAVDIRTVLIQIKTFWQQLDWPDVEESHTYISKILDVRPF